MASGTVKRSDSEKGHGSIAADEAGPDLVVHYSAISRRGYRSPEEDQRVEFDVERGDRGMQAASIRPL